jgi:dTDP-D-glucose 4,6-dehydratase
MAMKVLYIGGTGEVSPGCITAGLELGQDITVFNRGKSGRPLPKGVKHITGDLNEDAAFVPLGKQRWDAVCQFRTFDMRQYERDVTTFAGNVGQFLFISTAMVYRRPPDPFLVVESAPRENPYSGYAKNKMAIEDRLMELHAAKKLPVTVVRPSHTICTHFPGTFISGDHMAWRMIQGKPIISHGDGSSLWAVTRSEDFGRAFAKLLGNPKAMGEAFHITTDELKPWDAIYRAVAASLGVEAKLVHVTTDTLVKYEPNWAQPLLGDKTCSIGFDNSKVKNAVGGWESRHRLEETMRMSAGYVKERLKSFVLDEKVDGLIDRIIERQTGIGAN